MKHKVLLWGFLTISLLQILCPPQCVAVTKEGLVDILLSIDTSDSMNSAVQIAKANLPLLEEILLIPSGPYGARINSLSILSNAVNEGVYSKEKFLNIAFYQLKNINLLSRPGEVGREEQLLSGLLTNFSYSAFNNSGAPINENFQDLFLFLNSMLKENIINNLGIKNSLEKKFENAQKDFEKGKKETAINVLNAAINEINAQSGNQIDERGAIILTGYVNNLIVQIGKQ